MTEYRCPNCDIVVESNKKADGKLICPKCLDAYGKRFIMLQENTGSPNVKNMGDGLFIKDGE